MLYFVAGLLFLAVRDVVLPQADRYREQIADAVAGIVGLPVSIDRLSADLSGVRPRLHLSGLLLSDRDGRPALHLATVDATIAWSSLLRGEAHFHRLEIVRPELALRRDADGRLFVAGVPVESGAGPGVGFSGWLLGQREIVVRDAVVAWSDALRGAPELRLEHVDVRISNCGGRYRFGARAVPPASLASAVELRGDIATREPSEPASWSGEVYLAVADGDLGGWQSWVDGPFPLAGRGGMRAWLDLAGGRPVSAAASVALAGVTTRLAPDLPELRLDAARGWLSLAHSRAGRWQAAARGFELRTADGLAIAPTDLDFALQAPSSDGEGGGEGELRVNQADLGAWARLAGHLPLDPELRRRVAEFAPRGRVEALRLDWTGELGRPSDWSASARFSGLGLSPVGPVPGVAGLSGEVDGDARGGRFRVSGQDAALVMPAVFPEPRLEFALLRAEGGWSRSGGRFEVALDSAGFENHDAAGSASGWYRPSERGRGEIDLSARLTRADGGAVWRYMPRVVNGEVRDWLRRSLVGGVVPEARLRLKGDLADFPFADGKSGQFLVTTRVAGATLDYAAGWPKITDIHAELRFDGPSMTISAERARILDVALGPVAVEVPELGAHDGEVMTIRGRANGATAEFLRFVSQSPVRERIGGFTDEFVADGRGALDLTLVMPLHDFDATRIDGTYRFANNSLRIVEGLPPLADAAATVRFTGDALTIPDGRAKLYGEPLRLRAGPVAGGGLEFVATGAATAQALRLAHGWPALAHLSGTAGWRTVIGVRPQGTRVSVESDLAGVASSLPEPFNKSATLKWPVKIDIDFARGGERQDIRGEIAERARLEVTRRRANEGWRVERGALAVLAPLRAAEGGVGVTGAVDELDVDAWRKVLDASSGAASEAAGEAGGDALPVVAIELDAKRARAFGQSLAALKLDARAVADGWRGRISSREVDGSFDWRDAGDGALRARLRRLALEAGDETASSRRAEEDEEDEEGDGPQRLPALDVIADSFRIGDMDLGRLELRADNRGDGWHIDAMSVTNPDGRLAGTGRWRPSGRPLTELDFRLDTSDIGRFLARLGYGDVIRGGRAVLAGKLDWRGPPSRIDYGTLFGALTLEAQNGQFHTLEPGVGRLLGVLSLQALPRRLTLDFRDVFSEGFAFDRVSGSIDVRAGVMRTDDLLIRGPAAQVRMSGTADIEKETQDLRVTVQPTLSESVAIGAAAGLINPVAGVVAYVAQKALSDPIEKLFAFEYAVSGGWDDPKVEKLATAPRTAESEPANE